MSLIVVEADRAGFRRGRKLKKIGMYAQDTAELFFDDVRVPVSNLLGQEGMGFKYLMGELPQERFTIAVASAARLEAVLEQTIAYVKDRKAFGHTVWDFQNTKFKLADIKAQAIAVRLMIDHYLAEHLSRGLTLEEFGDSKAVCNRDPRKGARRDGPAPWRIWLYARISGRARFRRHPRDAHLWRHQRSDA